MSGGLSGGSEGGRGRTVVTIGVFDGLHLGHQAILARTKARAEGGPCVVMSFDPHPDVVLARGDFRSPPPLTPLGEKRALLKSLGMDRFEVLPFTRELASLEPEAFVDRHLVAPFAPSALVVGDGFALGRGRSGTVERLRTIGETRGFDVEAVPLVMMDGAPVSSTRIRASLGSGRVAEAGRLLGRRYGLAGTVVTGDGRGRELGFPTANLRLHEERLLPADGIYAVLASVAGQEGWHPAAMSIGVRPTFDGQVRTLEVHLLDWSGDLVGRTLAVEFVEWLRPELRFESVAALVAAMAGDVAETRRLLAGAASGPG
ncbi:MAG: bifunctional riboflavin kinase/FAD synthetase [Candidatus Eisenbacteria bacterium]|uniref:Riboflavin biosynthesis protein n=1 Tax=Eiseniibacteriota bacterium TaxID=2212470 RepID=A0A538U3M5_UNCEI|nr:MAG: bifunctional riboflavin kinase/FAD synthetase [Candidatus Eisenbacteria bacterium]